MFHRSDLGTKVTIINRGAHDEVGGGGLVPYCPLFRCVGGNCGAGKRFGGYE